MLSNVHVFVLFSSLLGSALGKFTSPPNGVDIYKRQHRTIEIPWKFDNDGKIGSVQWRYKKLDSSGSASVIYIVDSDGNAAGKVSVNQFTDRIEFRGDISRKDVTLAIRNFVKSDEGVFTCVVRGATIFQLSVTIKAAVLSNVTEFKTIGYNNSEIVRGDNITLSCTTTMGQPSPRVVIRKGNTLKNSTTTSNTGQTSLLYHFDQISKDEEGLYSCEVTTEGFTSKKSLQLDVKYPPEINSSVRTEQFGCRGRLMMIDCKASGDPKPVIMIIRPDGKRLPQNAGFTLKEFGRYRCEASNKLGNDFLDITVNSAEDLIVALPGKPNNLTVTTITSRSAIISWLDSKIGGRCGLSIFWIELKRDNNLIVSITTPKVNKYELNNLTPYSRYEISVAARNKNGFGNRTISFFSTCEEVPNGPPLNIRTTSRSAYSLSFEWDLPETTKQNGVIINFTACLLHSKKGPCFQTFITSERKWTVQNLNTATRYYIRVLASTKVGHGNYSESKGFFTSANSSTNRNDDGSEKYVVGIIIVVILLVISCVVSVYLIHQTRVKSSNIEVKQETNSDDHNLTDIYSNDNNYERVDDDQSTYSALKRPAPGEPNNDHVYAHLNQVLNNVPENAKQI